MNFEPSIVRLYINPLLPKTKPIIGSLILTEFISVPTPNLTRATEPSTPAFHPLLFLKSEFIKDQYGESPIKKEYIDTTLEPIRQKLLSQETLVAAFLVDGGPRGDILDSIFDLEDSNSGFRPTVFLCEAHRSYYAGPISRRPSGVFIKGSNITLNGEPAYKRVAAGKKAEFTYGRARASTEDLAEREMWFYESN